MRCSRVLAPPLALAIAVALSGCGGNAASGAAAGSPVVPAQVHRTAATSNGAAAAPTRIRDLAYQPRAGVQALAALAATPGSANPVSGAPPVPHPDEPPCIVTLFTGDTFENYSGQPFSYSPSCPGPWAKVVLHAHFAVTAGIQFDRTGSIWLGATNLFFGTTAEPSPGFSPQWSVEQDETNLSSIFATQSTGQVILGNTVNSTYNGIISGSAQLYFYPATADAPAPAVADAVVPFSAGPAGGTVSLNTTASTLSVMTTFPRNIERAYLDVYLQSQSSDEFWYSCFPNDLAQELNNCGSTAFREGEITIDGEPAGVAPIFPWVFTGGIDPNLWIPIVGVQTLDFKPYRVNLTPFAGVLDNGQPHTVAISVFNADNYFSATGSMLLFLDHGSKEVSGAVTADDIAADPNVSVGENVKIDASGNAKGSISTRASHPVRVSGYVDTSHGRVQTTVEDQIAFTNQQQIDFTSAESVQNLEQSTTVEQTVTSVSPQGIRAASTSFNWPFTLDFSYVVASTGAQTETTSVSQRYERRGVYLPGRPVDGTLSYLLDTVQTQDQLGISSAGALTSAQGSSNAQYDVFNSNGYCYDELLSSTNYLLTSSKQAGCR